MHLLELGDVPTNIDPLCPSYQIKNRPSVHPNLPIFQIQLASSWWILFCSSPLLLRCSWYLKLVALHISTANTLSPVAVVNTLSKMKLAVVSCLAASAAAFAPASVTKSSSSLSAVPFDRPSEALPFSKNGCPATLDGSLPGDAGFDPVGFSTTPIVELFDRKTAGGDTMSDLYWLREAEITHGRIAGKHTSHGPAAGGPHCRILSGIS